MRPQSEVRVAVASALVDGQGTTRQLAQRTGWSIGATRTALDNMARAGDVRKADNIRVPGVKRPVPVYARAVRAADDCHSSGAMTALLQAWATTREAAM